MPKPSPDTVPPFFHGYLKQVTEDDLLPALQHTLQPLVAVLEDLPQEMWDFRYAEGKWTIKELVQHIIDTERIFGYRALTFARKDPNPLPGFDENEYVLASDAGRRTGPSFLQELKLVRQSSILLFQSFSQEQLMATGVANGKTISVNAIGFIMAGHALHHLHILKDRYLINHPSTPGKAGS